MVHNIKKQRGKEKTLQFSQIFQMCAEAILVEGIAKLKAACSCKLLSRSVSTNYLTEKISNVDWRTIM